MNALIYPPIGSMKSRALARLLIGDSLTHLEFLYTASTYRLADIIWRLRGHGWPIDTKQKKVSTRDPVGRSSRIAIYSLQPHLIQQLGSKGKEYALKVFKWEKERAEKLAGVAATTPADEAAGIDNKTDLDNNSIGGDNEHE